MELCEEDLECAQEFSQILGNKKVIYDFFTKSLGLYLPESKYIDLKYLVQLMAGTKKALKREKIEDLCYEDIVCVSKDKLQQYCLENDVLKDYMPDVPINRDYTMKIIEYLDKGFTRKLINKYNIKAKPNKKDYFTRIKIGGEFSKLLLMIPVEMRDTTFDLEPDRPAHKRRKNGMFDQAGELFYKAKKYMRKNIMNENENAVESEQEPEGDENPERESKKKRSFLKIETKLEL